jgi:hypothetical protein
MADFTNLNLNNFKTIEAMELKLSHRDPLESYHLRTKFHENWYFKPEASHALGCFCSTVNNLFTTVTMVAYSKTVLDPCTYIIQTHLITVVKSIVYIKQLGCHGYHGT